MRALFGTAAVLVSLSVLLPSAPRAQANPALQTADARAGDAVGFDIAWNHVALSVPNIAESIAWYEKMLGFKGVVRGGQPNARPAGRGSPPRQHHHRAVSAAGRRAAAGVEEESVRRLPDARREALRLRGEEPARRPRGAEGQGREDGVRDARHPGTEAFAFISDNAGNAIELIEHKTPR